ncbi:hydantoinase B/oxoprolinase family protein [Hoeflea alexandrii]|uniref:hydantoinase B/oxoprolinase family protein n=1 Tax=Hoeflea alexandrii TaxID=288436 RepID=UPI00226E7C91|nr:hydantoinase B/oxoprolinase family protein [Hoeflea alexandrii]MCY0154763.1 hydantoinase B/oxoprolinase family protein [Hoeflea alexandrii]
MLAGGYSRNRVPVWGLNGGENGGTNAIAVTRRDGSSESYAFVSGLVIEPGDEITISTANGGGWGKPTGGNGRNMFPRG